MTKCPNCNKRMKLISTERTLPDPDFVNMDDQQMVDFFWEEITGDYRNYGVTEKVYECNKCDKRFVSKKK